MANILIATPTLSDAATLTAGNETAAGPVTNLQLMQPTDVWESNSTGSFVVIDLGGIVDFNLVSLLHTNATAFDQWRIRTADTEAGLTASPDFDSNFIVIQSALGIASVWYYFATTQTNRWIRVDITTASSPFMAGRLFVADALQPIWNYNYGAADGFDDDTVIDRTDGGNLIPNVGTNRSILNIDLNIADETERHTVREINRTRGASADVLIITDPAATTNKQDHLYHGLLQRTRNTIVTRFNRQNVNYLLTSL